jgi:capsular polysaccharide biosynthesis protein
MVPGGDAQAPQAPFSLRNVRQAILRRLWVVLLVALVFLGATFGISFWQTPVYEASAKLAVGVGQEPGVSQDTDLSKNVEGLQQISLSVVEAIQSRTVAQEVIQRLGLRMKPDELSENLTVEPEESTVFIHLSYRDTDPERAQQIVNAVGIVSSEQVSQISAGANNVTVTMWDDAVSPSAPVSPDPERNGILALGFGLMLGIGLALLAEYMDDRLRVPEEVEQITGMPSFGAVPDFEYVKDKK